MTWRNVVLESTQKTFSDSVVSGSAAALIVCRKMLQDGVSSGVRTEPGMK